LNDDGNLFDAFFLAALLAIKNTQIPEVKMSRDMIKIDDSKLKYLSVHHLPISTTFYFLKDYCDIPIVDVNTKEEKLCEARLSIVMNSYEDICGMTSLGALNLGSTQDTGDSDAGMDSQEGMDHSTLFHCMDIALEKAK